MDSSSSKKMSFDLLKKSISLISFFCDLQNENSSEMNLSSLKKLSNGILDEFVKPLIKNLQSSTPNFPTSDDLIEAQLLPYFGWHT